MATDRDEAVVGFGVSGPGRDADAPVAEELHALNLVDRARGTGLADRLVEELLEGRAAYLWVLAGNGRARAFYRRHGFRRGRRAHRARGDRGRRGADDPSHLEMSRTGGQRSVTTALPRTRRPARSSRACPNSSTG